MRTDDLQRAVDKLVTVREVMKLFDVTQPTVKDWREKCGLPTLIIKSHDRPAIRFVVDDVIAWAKRNGRAFDPKQARRLSSGKVAA